MQTRGQSWRRQICSGGAACLAAVLVVGCSTDFVSQVDGPEAFTVWGYVDVSADTQWVRVTPVRSSLDPDDGPLRAVVTLEDVASGERWTLRDSVFTFASGYRAHNLWAAVPIEFDRTYRLRVEGADGGITTADATTPTQAPTVTIRVGEYNYPATITVRGARQVVDLQLLYTVRRGGAVETATFSHYREVEPVPGGGFRALVYYLDDVGALGAVSREFEVVETRVLAASAGPGWPDLRGLSPGALALPVPTESVEGGLGFFGGVATVTIPFVHNEPY